MERHIASIGLVAVLVVGGTGLFAAGRIGSVGADEKSTTASIVIDNFSFTPKEVSVAKGTTVIWINHDDVPHTVVSKDQKFRSKALDTSDQFTFTFTDPGTYVYFCSVHPIMIGKVIVK
jgi:plastocyanin